MTPGKTKIWLSLDSTFTDFSKIEGILRSEIPNVEIYNCTIATEDNVATAEEVCKTIQAYKSKWQETAFPSD